MHLRFSLLRSCWFTIGLAFALGVTAVISPELALAAEGVGTLEMSDLLLEPQYQNTERAGGAFSLGSSYLAGQWARDRQISASVKVGSRRLIGAPGRYSVEPSSSEISIIEGYGQVDDDYGRVRMGLIPIPFGLEGGDAERRLRLPRSLLFANRFVNVRDVGVSYRIGAGAFFSDWSVHNGEGGADFDNESWLTARWGWDDGHNFRAGISGSAGRTTPKSTDPGGAVWGSLTGVNASKIARVRMANFFLDWLDEPVRLSFEITAGDSFQDDNDQKFRGGHIDLELRSWKALSVLARYDALSPRVDAVDTQITEITGGLAWRARYDNSVLYVLATKEMRAGGPQDVHRGMLIWRITPTASSFPSVL